MLVLTIVIFLTILIIGHELGHLLAAKRFGVKVTEFGFGLPPPLLSRQVGETKYSLNLLPIGGFVKIHGQHPEEDQSLEEPHRAFFNQPIYRRAIILVSGVAANFIIGWLALSFVFGMGVPPKLFITDVLPGSAAQEAGFKSNEIIEGWSSPEEFTNFIQAHRRETVTINNKTVTVPEEGIIGVRINAFSIPKENPLQSLLRGFDTAVEITVGVVKAASQIVVNAFTGDTSGLKQLTGPVGIFNIIKEAEGTVFLIYLLGAISINLTVFNLLPIPALDGGHLLFLGIEKIIRRPIPKRVEVIANTLGFAFLVFLILLVTFRDIMRL